MTHSSLIKFLDRQSMGPPTPVSELEQPELHKTTGSDLVVIPEAQVLALNKLFCMCGPPTEKSSETTDRSTPTGKPLALRDLNQTDVFII